MPTSIPIGNRIWVKAGNANSFASMKVSISMKQLQDSLKCQTTYCSDKLTPLNDFDSLISNRICGSTFHLATINDIRESGQAFRYIDLWRTAMAQGSPTAGKAIQVFWDENRRQFRHYSSSYIGQLITAFDVNNDTGFSVNYSDEMLANSVCVSDFLLDSSQVVRDTFRIVDTVKKQDTIQTRIVDTVKIQIRDTVLVRDTISIQKTIRDTVRIEKWYIDTVYRIDTVRVKDTVNISNCRDNIYSEVLWKSTGTRNNTSLTIGNESSDQSSIQIKTDERVSVEAYVYDNLGTFASHRTFEIENSPNGKYISFGGYADNGTRCADGIYLIRIVVKGNGFNRNTVYKVGLRG